MGQERGLDFAFDKIERSPNTLDAHRLIYWAAEEGRQDEIVTALFKAYFEQGLDIGNKAALAKLASENGFDEANIVERLNSDRDRDTIETEIAEAQRIGVTGVPFFIFNRKLAASGAQPPEQLLAAMRQAQSA